MSETAAKIGLGADLFDTTGRPMFGSAPLSLLSDAGLAWSVVPVKGGQLSPEAFTDYEALLIGAAKVSDAELKGESGRLRVIARNGVGYDVIDTGALNRRGILLTNTPIPVKHAVASTAVAFILALSLRMPVKSRLAREGRWRERANYPGVGLPGRTLGIIGLGGIGRELARLMQPYGMTILAADPHVGSAAAADVGVELCNLEELMTRSDFVVVACLLNNETRHLLNPTRLALMKPTAYLINVARGPIVDEEAFDRRASQRIDRRDWARRFRAGTARSRQSALRDGQCHFHRPLPLLDRFFRGRGRQGRDYRDHKRDPGPPARFRRQR
jgi:phosphoglycerate dehydrogenase-like enzyme